MSLVRAVLKDFYHMTACLHFKSFLALSLKYDLQGWCGYHRSKATCVLAAPRWRQRTSIHRGVRATSSGLGAIFGAVRVDCQCTSADEESIFMNHIERIFKYPYIIVYKWKGFGKLLHSVQSNPFRGHVFSLQCLVFSLSSWLSEGVWCTRLSLANGASLGLFGGPLLSPKVII